MHELPFPIDALDLGSASRGCEQVQRAGERAEVLTRNPPDELDGTRVEIRRREHTCQRLDLCRIAPVGNDVVFGKLVEPYDVGDDGTVAEVDAHRAAHLHRCELIRHAVIEGSVERTRGYIDYD